MTDMLIPCPVQWPFPKSYSGFPPRPLYVPPPPPPIEDAPF